MHNRSTRSDVINIFMSEQRLADPPIDAPVCPIMVGHGYPSVGNMDRCQFPESRARLGKEISCSKDLPCPVAAKLSGLLN
jgi:hypothetical protein